MKISIIVSFISVAVIATQYADSTIITTAPGTITSPKYPDLYTNDLDIFWNIIAPVGNKIEITPNDFLTELNLDVLTIYDGDSINAKLLASWSGQVGAVIPIISSGNNLYLRFKTDVSVAYKGFKLYYSFTGPCTCLETTGTICGSRASPTSPYLKGGCEQKVLYSCLTITAPAELNQRCSDLLGCSEISAGVDKCKAGRIDTKEINSRK